MTLLELLKRTTLGQKIDLFNNNVSVICLNLTRGELVDYLLLNCEKNFGSILNCDIERIGIVENNLEITLRESF